MKSTLIGIAGLSCLAYLGACQTANFRPPPAPADLAATGARQDVDLVVLGKGRTVFVSRCIECHTLPPISRHSAAAWPHLVDDMAGRARLKPDEREALVAYILAAREKP